MSEAPMLIALSAGGLDSELAAHGLGMEHVDELMVRLSRQLLREGHRLSFGGTLGDPDARLTELLIDAAHGWLGEHAAESADVTQPLSWPLRNYSGWPYYTLVTPERKAELVGVCHFVEVPPPGVSADELAQLTAEGEATSKRREIWRTDLAARRYTADALTRMRQLSAQDAKLRIVWGGRIRGAAGWMAGIAEEVLFSLQEQCPVLILGGFGGCARVLADFLQAPDADWPEALTLDDACRDPAYKELIKDEDHRRELAAHYDELRQRLTLFRSELHAGQNLYGAPAHLLRSALTDESARRAIQLARQVAQSLHG